MRRLQCLPQWTAVRFIAATRMHFAPEAASGFQCSVCGKGFRLLNALNHHIATRHAGQAKPLAVDVDGKTSEAAVVAKTATPQVQPQPQKPSAAPSMPGVFPGLFPGAQALATPSSAEGSAPSDDGADDPEKKLFVCTVCQKTFRLEAALQHHYQAKHGMEMPQPQQSSPSAQVGGVGGLKQATGAFGVNLASVLEGAADAPSITQYVHVGDPTQPSMPQYHLDVAPNAPEEGDLAAHWRLVNHCVLVGEVSEIQEGYVFEERVLQCLVATDFDNPSPGDPDKDFHTVRIYGSAETLQAMKSIVTPNSRVFVSGRLRLVPQFDTITNKYYHHPVVIVPEGGGSVHSM